MNLLVLHNALGANPTVIEQDVLIQRDAVVIALHSLGFHVSTFGCTLDLAAVRQTILEHRPNVVFNLVESLADTDRLMPLVPLLLDALQIPYTGASSAAILATGSKRRAKERLRQSGLPTPAWVELDRRDSETVDERHSCLPEHWPSQWIIKPVWEHASLGMDDDSVIESPDLADLTLQLSQRQDQCNLPMLAEQYIDGREFNLSLLGGAVLPPAEIDFVAYPPGKPHIVGHRAKWDEASFEYRQTPRKFQFPDSDNSLLETLEDLARECWDLFELSGFARVDFRVDSDGQPWILEVNVNPCLSPDAGFAAALAEGGLSYVDGLQRITSEALRLSHEAITH